MNREDIKEALGRFPRERTYLLPALQALQEELRWLPAWALEEVSAYLRVPKSEVYGVASSFPELRLKEPGKQVVRVCTGLGCYLSGAPAILQELKLALGIQAGQTTPDGEITLEESPCLFICSVAPALALDGICLGKITPHEAMERVKSLVKAVSRKTVR